MKVMKKSEKNQENKEMNNKFEQGKTSSLWLGLYEGSIEG